MRKKIFMVWACIRWLVLMFMIAPALEAPLVAFPSQPIKPLRVWTGLASWYGPRFHGRLTANGEVFDANASTAAHPSLPFGSLVRVMNPRNGRSQLVRINDRGPFVEGRDLDLSYHVAQRLGMEGQGVARLRMELLEVPQRR
jgi:rare lipoprotein A